MCHFLPLEADAHSAIDREIRAGDVTCRRRDEKTNDLSNLFGFSETAKRSLGLDDISETTQCFFWQPKLPESGCIDWTRSDAIYSNLSRSQFDCKSARESFGCRFC